MQIYLTLNIIRQIVDSYFSLLIASLNRHVLILGVGGILVMGVGIIISGVFILRVKPNARFVAAWIAFTAVLYALGTNIICYTKPLISRDSKAPKLKEFFSCVLKQFYSRLIFLKNFVCFFL